MHVQLIYSSFFYICKSLHGLGPITTWDPNIKQSNLHWPKQYFKMKLYGLTSPREALHISVLSLCKYQMNGKSFLWSLARSFVKLFHIEIVEQSKNINLISITMSLFGKSMLQSYLIRSAIDTIFKFSFWAN